MLIIECGANGANFSACGYDFFASYDPAGRVHLVDLGAEPLSLAAVPGGGLAYGAILIPQVVLDPQAIYVSVGKMKTHGETLATLSTKNQFGLPAVDRYISRLSHGRFAMHDRGLTQAIVDINVLRPTHFAVIDAIVGLEGLGPTFGSPVSVNLVLAGSNSVAVDRVALQAMGINPAGVRHLVLAARAGLGPADLAAVTVAGEPLAQRTFAPPPFVAPILEYPCVFPSTFAPALGHSVSALTWYLDPVVRELDVLELNEASPAVRVVRTLAPLAARRAGHELFTWDGRDNDGALVPPGHMPFTCARSSRAREHAPPTASVGCSHSETGGKTHVTNFKRSAAALAVMAAVFAPGFWVRADVQLVVAPTVGHGYPVGTTILFTATPQGTGAHLFRFRVGRASGPRTLVRDFNPRSHLDWTPMEDGAFDIEATARNTITGETGTATVTYIVSSRATGGTPVVGPTLHPLVALYSAPPCAAGAMRVRYAARRAAASRSRPSSRAGRGAASISTWRDCIPTPLISCGTNSCRRHDARTNADISHAGGVNGHAVNRRVEPARRAGTVPWKGLSCTEIVTNHQRKTFPVATDLAGNVCGTTTGRCSGGKPARTSSVRSLAATC